MGVGTVASVSATNSKFCSATIQLQDEVTYEEISVDELPQPVAKAVQEGYADYTVTKTSVGSDGSYKVDLKKNEESISVFFNAEGEFLKIEQGGAEEETDPMYK